jgi:hypothetical protein
MEWWKIKAHLKGDIFGVPISEREYYYLMFGCVNQKCIDRVKQDGQRLKMLIENRKLSKAMEAYK